MAKSSIRKVAVSLACIMCFQASASAIVVEVKDHLGSPTIFIDKVPQVPMMFFGNIVGGPSDIPEANTFDGKAFSSPKQSSIVGSRSWNTVLSEAELASHAGIHMFSFDAGSVPWATQDSKPDYSLIDSIIEGFIKVDPQALIFPRVYLSLPPAWWVENYPGHCMVFSDGQKPSVGSVASKIWRRDAIENFRNLIRHCEAKYGEHMLGYFPTGQETGEWFYRRTWENVHSGFEEAMRAGFAEWAHQKYGTVEKLRQAWNQPDVTFEAVRVPTVAEREKEPTTIFYNPLKDRFLIDFNRYQQVAMAETIEEIAHAIKEETKNKKLVFVFYGYQFAVAPAPKGLAATGQLGLGRLLKCRDVDILCSPVDYFDRSLGGCGPLMGPDDSIRDAGKLRCIEDDTRTYLSRADNADNNTFGRVASLEGTRWVHQRNFGQVLPRRFGCWYMDLWGLGWVNSPEIWDTISKLRKIYAQQLSVRASWEPEVAVIIDEESPLFLASNSRLTTPLLSKFRKEFYRMGAPFRINLLGDVLSGRVKLPKVTLFVGCNYVTSEQRAKIAKLLKGKTAMWFYGSGYLNEQQASMENIEKMTGFGLRENVGGMSGTIRFDITNDLTKGLVDVNSALYCDFDPEGGVSPLWSIKEDANIIPLAHFNDGTLAAAYKENGKTRSVYVGTAGCPAGLLRNILYKAGVHVFINSDEVLVSDGSFLSVTASTPGVKEIFIPKGMVLQDAYSEAVLTAVDGKVCEKFEFGQTKQYLLKPGRIKK